MSCLLDNFPTEAGDSCFYRNKQTELVWIRNLGTREVASEEPTVLYTGPDMTKIFHASSYGIFIEIQSNHWRKKLHRRNQDSNFLWGSLRAPIKFRRKIQLWDLKRWFLLENRPNHFIINSSSFIRLFKWNKLNFSSIEIKKPLPSLVQCLAGQSQIQKPTLTFTTNQMPGHNLQYCRSSGILQYHQEGH